MLTCARFRIVGERSQELRKLRCYWRQCAGLRVRNCRTCTLNKKVSTNKTSLHRCIGPTIARRCATAAWRGFSSSEAQWKKATREEILRKHVCHISSHHCHYSVSFSFFSFGTLAICMIDSKALRQAGSFLFCSVSDSC